MRILGIGSPSGDDQAGWLVVDALLARGLQRDGKVVIEKLDRPGANLIACMENADWVVLIDAMQSGAPVGLIRRFDLADWPDHAHGLSSHGLGVLYALSLARELGSLPPRLDIYAIEIGPVKPGETPGAAIRDAALRLAGIIELECAAA